MTIDKKSPYWNEAGYAEARRSVVAFIDLLGFKEEIKRAYAGHKEAELLARLRNALDMRYVYLEPFPLGNRRPWDVKAFTDSIIIGHPIHNTGESQMLTVFSNLANFQLETILNGFFVRGGIAIGDLFVEQDVIFGKCLIEAYEAESEQACDPRIILSQSAIDLVTDLDDCFGIERSSHYRDLLLDSDNLIFLNYLTNVLVESQHTSALLNKHKAMIEICLKQFATERRIRSKYLWVANYHNYFCRTFTKLDETYLIDVGSRVDPKQLTSRELKSLKSNL